LGQIYLKLNQKWWKMLIDPRLQILQLQAVGFKVYDILDSEEPAIQLLNPDPEKYIFHFLAH